MNPHQKNKVDVSVSRCSATCDNVFKECQGLTAIQLVSYGRGAEAVPALWQAPQ